MRGLGRCRGPRARTLLLTIPFVLLFNTDRVVVNTRMFGDVSGVRRIEATGDSSLAREIRLWVGDMARGWDSAGTHTNGDTIVAARSIQRNSLSGYDDVEADALDIVQQPWSLVTTYHWRETVTLDFLGNEKEAAAAPLTGFEYRLTMPGTIRETSPIAQDVVGGTAMWELKANAREQVVTATATAVRWDAVLVIAYIVGYLAFRLLTFLAKKARLQPRKI